MKDLYVFLKEFASSVNDRLKFPVFNAFLISWVVLNWQGIFIVLFSDQPIEVRIHTVNQEYREIWSNLVYPLILAIAYTIGIPWLKKALFWMLSEVNKDNRDKDILYVISSYKEKINLAREEVKLEVERAKYLDLKDLNDTIEKLRAEIASEKLEKDALKKEIVEKDRNIEKLKKNHDHVVGRFSDNTTHYQFRAKDLEKLLDQYYAFAQNVTTEEYRNDATKKDFFRTYLSEIESLADEYHRLKTVE